jgi:hypothetical protein
VTSNHELSDTLLNIDCNASADGDGIESIFPQSIFGNPACKAVNIPGDFSDPA